MFQPIKPLQSAGAVALAPVRPLRLKLLPPVEPQLFPYPADPIAVDLTRDIFSRRWWRGVATLALLCAAALTMALPERLPAVPPPPLAEGEQEQWQAIAVAPLRENGRTGLPMAETASVTPLAQAPERQSVEMFARLGRGDSIARLLVRMGARAEDAREAQSLIAAAAPRGIGAGTSISISLGQRDGIVTGSGLAVRRIERLALRATLDLRLEVERDATGLRLKRIPIAVDTAPLRVRGRVADGLYWSLRSAGVAPETAQDYLRAIGGQIDVGEIGGDDRFDLIFASRRAETGETVPGPLLYAGLDRIAADDLQLMRWTVDGRSRWIEAGGAGQQSAAMMWPVHGRITSRFGRRVHPILRFARMHSGIDFGAGWGAPIVAAADGVVTAAGWHGGYGRQVRLAHRGGLGTSYSHMSSIAVAPGTVVRQGQLIGHVGSSGLSTGPHLHYEVYRGGRAIDPMSVRFAARAQLEGAELDAFRIRLKALLKVGPRG